MLMSVTKSQQRYRATSIVLTLDFSSSSSSSSSLPFEVDEALAAEILIEGVVCCVAAVAEVDVCY